MKRTAETTDDPTTPSARDRLLDTAARLFYGRGINATGIDLVLSESAVSKGSLYHHFDGKQGLLLAYLERERDGWLANAMNIDDPGVSAGDRVELLFGSIGVAVRSGTFHGCPFTNAVIERPDDAEVQAVVEDHNRQLSEHIADLIGRPASDRVVEQIFVLYNGALTTLKVTRDLGYAQQASQLARRLVEE